MASYEKNKTGKWSVRFRIFENGNIVHKRLCNFKLKKDAESAYRKEMAKYSSQEQKSVKLTLRDLYEEYMRFQQSRQKDSTQIENEMLCRLHILPYFNDHTVENITPQDILHWQQEIENKNFRYRYKQKIRIQFNGLFKYGQKYLGVRNDPFSRVDSFRRLEPKREMKIWTPEQFTQFICAVKDPIENAFFTLLFFTGLRKGEALALLWKDIDFTNCKLTVNKSITRKSLDKSNPYQVTTPKNESSYRTIVFNSNVHEKLIFLYGAGQPGNNYVFYGKRPLIDTSLLRHYKEVCTIANLDSIRLHDFRHSHASYLISQGINIVAIAKRLGHSNIEQTLNTYAHLLPQSDDEILNALDKI